MQKTIRIHGRNFLELKAEGGGVVWVNTEKITSIYVESSSGSTVIVLGADMVRVKPNPRDIIRVLGGALYTLS